jgi:hypothetical protein
MLASLVSEQATPLQDAHQTLTSAKFVQMQQVLMFMTTHSVHPQLCPFKVLQNAPTVSAHTQLTEQSTNHVTRPTFVILLLLLAVIPQVQPKVLALPQQVLLVIHSPSPPVTSVKDATVLLTLLKVEPALLIPPVQLLPVLNNHSISNNASLPAARVSPVHSSLMMVLHAVQLLALLKSTHTSAVSRIT